MTTITRPESGYLLGSSEAERRRLMRQGEVINPFTLRLLAEAGITRGMRVLDVGTGAGQEWHMTPTALRCSPRLPLWEQAWRWNIETMQGAGVHLDLGYRPHDLPSWLTATPRRSPWIARCRRSRAFPIPPHELGSTVPRPEDGS